MYSRPVGALYTYSRLSGASPIYQNPSRSFSMAAMFGSCCASQRGCERTPSGSGSACQPSPADTKRKNPSASSPTS